MSCGEIIKNFASTTDCILTPDEVEGVGGRPLLCSVLITADGGAGDDEVLGWLMRLLSFFW